MGNYNYFKASTKPKKKTLHPIWYGIGCLLTIITPILSGAAALVFLDFGKSQNWSYIYQLSGTVRFPPWVYKTPIINLAANYLSSIDYFFAKITFFVVFLLLFIGLSTLLNAILYRRFGPPRYSGVDAPPPTRKPKHRSR